VSYQPARPRSSTRGIGCGNPGRRAPNVVPNPGARARLPLMAGNHRDSPDPRTNGGAPRLVGMPAVKRALRHAIVAAPLVAALTGCGSDFSFCSDTSPDPPNCEVCNNGRDDDLDGDIDCSDSDCSDAAVCRDRSRELTTTTIEPFSEENAASTFLVKP
jgi:hypothetical protein